jgi:carbonic anhydrase
MNTRHLHAALSGALLCLACTNASAEGAHHWGYQGSSGPSHWAAMEPEFAACAAGREQSPIDIREGATQQEKLSAIAFDYRPSPLKIVNNGHTVQVNYAPGSFITVDGARYELQQFHFHKPSEEAIDGRHADMSAHLVHKDAQGRLAVVAVLLKAGTINPMMATLWNNLPATDHEAEPAGVQVDAADLLPAGAGYYTFAGSLTTPPCSEGVTWFVMKTPASVSAGEIARFGEIYPMNARPLQGLNGRVVRTGP